MPARRPVGITVFAILNLVFGGLFLLCNVCGLGSVAFQGQMEQFQVEAQKGVPIRLTPKGFKLISRPKPLAISCSSGLVP